MTLIVEALLPLARTSLRRASSVEYCRMLIAESKKPPTGLLGELSSPLRLRIRGGALDGRLVTISEPKCLVGGNDVCHLRVPGGNDSLAWILRGKKRTILR